MGDKLDYYGVKYIIFNNDKIYSIGERIVFGLSKYHARENVIPSLLNDLETKEEYGYYCGLQLRLKVKIKSVEKLENIVFNTEIFN
jgi:hypothetical protein